MFFPSAHPQFGTGTEELLGRGSPHAATMIPTPNPWVAWEACPRRAAEPETRRN